MLHQPREQRGLELLLDSEVKRRLARLWILIVHISAFQREKLGGFEFFPVPAGEEWRPTAGDIDDRAGANQQIKDLNIFVPASGVESTAGGSARPSPTFYEELHQREISPAGDGKPKRGTPVATRHRRLDIQSTIQQKVHHPCGRRFWHLQLRTGR